ncbi:unnamed protein product [Symbiodinium natans]|uniref:Uncharacterized protein n=1 Tax=Symbiodinium natans TaxID=878477 RepID=A0A812S6H5_9DINO|nr:unnamed protein product [Symbiodinium natans]
MGVQVVSDKSNYEGETSLCPRQALVRELFEKDGVDLELCIRRQDEVMKALGLERCDLGAINRNERGEDIYNQCFYLALARSYLGCDSDVLKETALTFKRNIEAAVLAAHPEWGGSRVGEDVQAFSDFLFYVLGSHALLAELSVAVFDATSGGVELYIGLAYLLRNPQPLSGSALSGSLSLGPFWGPFYKVARLVPGVDCRQAESVIVPFAVLLQGGKRLAFTGRTGCRQPQLAVPTKVCNLW